MTGTLGYWFVADWEVGAVIESQGKWNDPLSLQQLHFIHIVTKKFILTQMSKYLPPTSLKIEILWWLFDAISKTVNESSTKHPALTYWVYTSELDSTIRPHCCVFFCWNETKKPSSEIQSVFCVFVPVSGEDIHSVPTGLLAAGWVTLRVSACSFRDVIQQQ